MKQNIRQKKVQKKTDQINKQNKNCLNLNWRKKQWQGVVKCSKSQQLTELSLWDCGITSNKMNILRDIEWKCLKNLYISHNYIGSEGVKLLVKSNMIHLQKLGLYQCELGNEAIHHLIKSYWPNLRTLYLSKNRMQLNSFEYLSQGAWNKLQNLQIYPNKKHQEYIYSINLLMIVGIQSKYIELNYKQDIIWYDQPRVYAHQVLKTRFNYIKIQHK